MNVLGVVALLVLFRVISEDWWVTLALSYLPRAPYVVPALVLCVASLLLRKRWLFVLNLISAMLVLGPIMGGRLGLARLSAPPDAPRLRLLSCNVQDWAGDPEKLRAEFAVANPDVIALQEAPRGLGPLAGTYSDWHVAGYGGLYVASRFPVTLVDRCYTNSKRDFRGILCRVEGPDGPFLLANIHFMTIRFGLMHLKPDSLQTGEGVDELLEHQVRRPIESWETRAFLAHYTGELPLLVVGDFNTPTTSSLFQPVWGDMTSAFDTAGFGFGYTSPCNTGRHWPANTPWLRIDHILCDRHWHVSECWIGASDGSDHRFIAADLRLRDSHRSH